MKRSLKYIKLKIKNEGKKGHFVSFYDRIKEINEKEKLQTYNLLEDSNYYNSSKSYKPNNDDNVDEELKNTNFHAALQEYYKNCCNPEFRRCCRELFPLSKNLILILLNKDTIFSIILKYIENSKIKNDETYFYKLLVILIKDLKDESKKYLEDILKTLFRKINFNNLDLLEEIFSSYANIFRIMNKNIIKNIDKYIKISLPLFQHRNSIIKIFIADSFSYLLRKLSLHDLILCFSKLYSFFNIVTKNKLKHYSETISLLMLESLKVDNDKLSKKTLPFLKYIIHSIYLRKQYDCIETGHIYNPLDNINGVIQHIHKAIQLFFIDIYNFTKKGSFEFWDVFLTYILQNYSILYERYFNYILTSNNKDTIIDTLTDADKYSHVMKCLEKNEKDNEDISPKCEENLSGHENSNIKKDVIFIKYIFYEATNFFLKNILNIWMQKNHEKKNIIIETIRLELKKYADKLNNIELNYLTFIYIWNLYDNIFFIFNYDSINNEKITNIYISFARMYMGILEGDNEGPNKNNYTNYLLQFFIIKVVNILKKNMLNHNEVHLNKFLKYILIRIMQNLKLNNVYGCSTNQSLITNSTPFMLDFKSNVENETKFILDNIASSENNNLILANFFLLCDIIKIFNNKTTEINVDCIDDLDFLCDDNNKNIKNNNTEKKRKHNMLDNDFNSALNGEGIYNSNKSKIVCLNQKTDNHEVKLDFKDTSPTEIYMQIEDFVIYIFDEIKKLLIILKHINQYDSDENTAKENVDAYLKSTIYFLFAFINFLSQISVTHSNALLILNGKVNTNDKDMCLNEEKDCIVTLLEICNVLENIKCGKFMQNNILENNTSDIRSNMNSIIIDIHLIITALQISSQGNNINMNDINLSNNNIPFLVNYINKWGMEDIYYCDKYLHKFQNIFINLYKLNYFESRLDDIFLYLKFFERVLIYYETINKQKLLRVIKTLVAIYINLKKNKDINEMVENEEYTLKKTTEQCYGKILLLFDNFIYLESKEYLSTHIQIYESKIVDVVSFLNFLKNVDVFKNYIFKICAKICIIELTMLLNAKLSIIPKYVISNLKSFFETQNANHKFQGAIQNNYQSKYYFYIIKNIYKTTRKKLNIFEELIEKNYIRYEEFTNNSRQTNDCIINYNDEHDMKEEKEDINEELYIDGDNYNYMPIINTNEYENHIEQYACENKNNDTFKILCFENFNIQNFVRNILCSFDLLIVPIYNNNNLNKSDRIELLNIYIWIIAYVNIKCNYYIHEYKCYKLIDIIFDIASHMNNIFPNNVENIFDITKQNIYNELNNIHTKSIPNLVGLIKYFIKIFVSNFIYNVNILNTENMSKFVKILCSYNNELNNYKNDIEEILLDKNINFTKLILNIKEEDNSNIIRILIKIIFWLLKKKKGKGGFKKQKNIIFYLSSIPDEQNWCHIFLPIIYSFTNVYKNCIKYDNLVRHEEKENTLLEFLITYKGNFFQCWNYDFDIKMRDNSIQNDDNENADFSYDSIFNYSHWNFNNHIIEIKKEIFKNGNFRRNFQLFVDMLKIIKYKLSPYFEFFLHIFITISHYINAYLYIKKKIKTAKNIRLCVKQIDNSKYMNSLLFIDQTAFENGSKIDAHILSDHINNNESDDVSGNNNNNEYESRMGNVIDQIDKVDKMGTECPDFKEIFVDLSMPNSFLKNINKKCIESSQFIMENVDVSECNLVKAKDLFVFLFKKNLKSLKAKNIFLNILFNTWCKNEAYYNFYNTVVPNSIYLLIKAVNSKEIIKKLTFEEWEQITEKVFNIILRLCGYDTDEQEYEEKAKDEKKYTKKNQDKHKIILNPLVDGKSNQNRLLNSLGLKILKPYIPDIILCIKKSILKRYQNFLQKKNNETSFIKKRKMQEFKIISNKELYILIELSSINKNKIYNIHVINTISTFMLANPKTLHSTKDQDVSKIKLILISLKILIINLSKSTNNLTKRKKSNFNFSYQRYSSKNAIEEYVNKLREADKPNNDKKYSRRTNASAHISESSFYYNSYKMYICYKLKTVLYEIIQRCYDLDCRILSGELLIMIGCIFLKIKNIENYLKLFKKNTEKFLAKTNDLNYNSKTVLKYIMKIPLKNIKTIKQNKHYTFLQISQIYSSLNLCNERSTNEYDSDIQFLILLDLCNIKMSSIKNNYLIRDNVNIERDDNKNNCNFNQMDMSDKEGNNLDISMPENLNDIKEHNKMKLKKKLHTFNDLFLNSNKIFLEILIRHCLFLIFNNNTNEMVVDKSIKFILLIAKILGCLLQLYKNKNTEETKNEINSQNERICYDHIKRDIQIYVHFVINIIMPKALNALKKNSDNFTKISLQIILMVSKNVCPYINVLKSLNIAKFLKDIKDSCIKKYELNEQTNSLFGFDTLRKEKEKNIYEDNNTTYNYQKVKKYDEVSFKSVEKFLFYDLYYYIGSKQHEDDDDNNNNKITKLKDNVHDESASIIQNIIDIKSENNLEGIKKMITIAHNLCYYTICKIIIPISLNYIIQRNSKRETFNKNLSLNSIKLLGVCSEKIGIKNVYEILGLLLLELKTKSFNNLYIEKTVSHLLRAYHFNEFKENSLVSQINQNENKQEEESEVENEEAKQSSDKEKINDKLSDDDKKEYENEENENIGNNNSYDTQILNQRGGKYSQGKSHLYCQKFNNKILPQLRSLMFEKPSSNNSKNKKTYINDLVTDYKNKDVIAKPDIILSFLVILNKINYNFDKELNRIIYKLCFCLSSVKNNIRSESKKALCNISMYLGLNYIDLIITQMSDYLTKGYHIPVFLCTVNSILESVLYEKDKFLNKNCLNVNFNILTEPDISKRNHAPNNKRRKILRSKNYEIEKKDARNCYTKNEKFIEDNFLYSNICKNIFNMIKLEIINDIEKNTEDVNKKKIKRKTTESQKNYGSNIIKLLAIIMPGECIENNILTFLESLFSGESFENNEVDKNFIFKKKYIHIISSYFSYFIKGVEENKNISPKFILNIIYKLLVKATYVFKGDIYENLIDVMKNTNILYFKYNLDNEITGYNHFKRTLQFYLSKQKPQDKFLGYNYNMKYIQYPEKKNNLDIIEGSFQEKNIYDSFSKTKKYDFKVHAQALARVALKLLLFIIKRLSRFVTAQRLKLNIPMQGQTNSLIHSSINNISNGDNIENIGDIQSCEPEETKLGPSSIEEEKEDTVISMEKIDSKMTLENNYGIVEFIRLIEPLLVYCYCYGKDDVFVMSSNCIKLIKKKKYSNFNKYGKLIILSSVDILKNIPNYYSKEFDRLILSCIDTLTYIIKNNNNNDIISWLNYDTSNREISDNTNEKDSSMNNNVPPKKRKMKHGKNSMENNRDEDKIKRQKKISYILDENIISTYYKNDYEENYEESINSLRYCLIDQISLLLESKNHIWELLLLFKNCLLREDINNIIKKGIIVLKINSCIDQIFTIMIEESHNLKLSFLCGQIYINFLMSFPISKNEKKKKVLQILNNLDDENDDSRIAVLNSLYLFLNRSNAKLLKDGFYYIIFTSLLVNFSKETNPKCKKMYVFLLSLLFQQIDDMNYVFNSYKILKNNLSFSIKSPVIYTYLYLLPVFASFFYKNISEYNRKTLISLEENETTSLTKEQKKNRQKQIKQDMKQVEEQDHNHMQEQDQNDNNEQNIFQTNGTTSKNNLQNSLATVRNYFLEELLKYANNDLNMNKMSTNEKTERENNNKRKLNNANSGLFSEQNCNIVFMKNQLEDLFLSLMFYLIDHTYPNIKLYMKEDKNCINILTSNENITYFSKKHYLYKKNINKDTVHLVYSTLEQIFTYIDTNLIDKMLNKKYIHEKYQGYFIHNEKDNFTNMNEIDNNEEDNSHSDKDQTHDKLIIYFLYFWNLLFENALYNKNPFIQIISLKIVMNYINKKMSYPYFPLLLVKLYSTDKFIINIIIKKVLSLVLSSYFLEHFYTYHKEISVLLLNICKLIVLFPWITNGFEEQNDQNDALNQGTNTIDTVSRDSLFKTSKKNHENDLEQNHIHKNNVNQWDHTNKNGNSNDNDDNKSNEDEVDDEEFKEINGILQNENYIKVHSFSQYNYQNEDERNEIKDDIKINKEILSYSKFFLIIITLSRAISLHLINNKKSFTRILTILNVYKNIIQDFPIDLWNPDNGIIHNVITPLYKLASLRKKKHFTEDSTIFEETSSEKKLTYLSNFSWYIISLLEEKLQDKKNIFNKAFIQARHSINRIRFLKKRRKNILAVKNPKLYTSILLSRREKKKQKKKAN
ncbi:conserved Plasmodium protein, unknown function [Plasmodium chabaudi adami]|uniref:U3 small nucleolar RNA-associated protein 20 domain-containing protein n=1 Tax=Plasmodium chabaudi adami TaxID=5826 RepID=A0A1C6Y7R7_PLACE|nr:conserved Plasmodium protein, unknown function [Plasmodium chabaudi adami]